MKNLGVNFPGVKNPGVNYPGVNDPGVNNPRSYSNLCEETPMVNRKILQQPM